MVKILICLSVSTPDSSLAKVGQFSLKVVKDIIHCLCPAVQYCNAAEPGECCKFIKVDNFSACRLWVAGWSPRAESSVCCVALLEATGEMKLF